MTSSRQHQAQFKAILDELHEVSKRLHSIADEVCLQKQVVDTIVRSMLGEELTPAARIPSQSVMESVRHDIADAQADHDEKEAQDARDGNSHG